MFSTEIALEMELQHSYPTHNTGIHNDSVVFPTPYVPGYDSSFFQSFTVSHIVQLLQSWHDLPSVYDIK